MITMLLLLHLVIAVALVGVVLLQRSEGGGLGIGGGGGGFMTGRGTANFLTRMTIGLSAAFFLTSIGLSLLSRHGTSSLSPLDTTRPTNSGPAQSGATPGKGPSGVLDSLERGKQRLPSPPKSE